jgi:S1-C subfamily serine protease
MAASRFTLALLATLLAALPVAGRQLAYRSGSETIDLAGLEEAFCTLAESAAPSVVAVTAVGPGLAVPVELDGVPLDGPGLDKLLGRRHRTVGTGFAIEADGIILTNEHVVGGATRVWCTTDDGRVLPAVVLGTDPRSDLAVLKIAADLPPVTFAEDVRRGQWCVALGNPLGLAGLDEMNVSAGLISATGRDLPRLARAEDRLYENLLQFTAEVNPGNSGGPLLNLRGEVVGVVTAVVLPQRQTFGLGFAVPADQTLQDRVARLKSGQPVAYATLGVRVADANGSGVRVAGIDEASPAAGVLQVGDVIRAVDDGVPDDGPSLVRRVHHMNVGEAARLAVERDGRRLLLTVVLHASTEHRKPVVARHNRRLRWRGLTLAPLPSRWRAAGASGVIVVAAADGAPAERGQVLTTINGHPVATLADVLDAGTDAFALQTLGPALPKPNVAVASATFSAE